MRSGAGVCWQICCSAIFPSADSTWPDIAKTALKRKAPTHEDNVKPFKSIRRGCQRTGSRAAVPRVQSDKNLLMATQLETFAECRIYRHPATSYVFCYTQLTKQERSAKLINASLGRIYWLGEFHTSGLGVYFLKHKLVCSNRKQNFIIVYACYAMNRRRAFKCPAVSVI